MASDTETKIKILADNRKARHDYHLLDRIEAGIVLAGTEVKAARDGKVQLRDSYAEIEKDEAWLVNVHISEYTHGSVYNHVPLRRRKLLLHRAEINKLAWKTREKGLTMVPTKIYVKDGIIKCELALARGKQEYDKRAAIRKREQEAHARSELRRHTK